MNADWFLTQQFSENIYLTTEQHFFMGNRSNIWLIKGSSQAVIIDSGLGVCNLRSHLLKHGLLHEDELHTVVLTHNHFDHSGGAKHFDNVFIHQEDQSGLLHGKGRECLNYVSQSNFEQQPHEGFSACNYAVQPTPCQSLRDGEIIHLGDGEHLEILHIPGHTKGSIAVYYPQKHILFTGDTVYECGSGGNLLDWLPTSDVNKYMQSAYRLIDWISENPVKTVCPGHFQPLKTQRTIALLEEYIHSREGCVCRGCTRGLSCCLAGFFTLGLHKCCSPC